MNDIQVRPARPDELQVLWEFEQGIILAERPFDKTLLPGHFHYYDLAKMIENEETEVVVAVQGDKLIGSGHARIMEAKPFNQFERYAFLGFMYVVPEMRGKGVNRLIIDALVQWAKNRGLEEIRLHVYSDNAPAIAAYEKVGFKKILTEMRLDLD
ncbi:GNAT family N-acetyltransferase [Dyadobacter luticola]|uniref:GNAT family N-acetyltransferase n=1 Tax=Dyadobacter luticola TaxID=1979387 RepID=A0A5R9L0R4_9BACT|nr:GNAT family N-acetyltransferase [Dyadobacter luticola]TLV02146.1 GNAT family N-acetyltransferase [Dyadobacter luticola]